MFRPVNSSESNLFTIRVSIGYGSSIGNFVFGATGTYTIASSTGALISPGTSFLNYLASPSFSNLPSGFYINYNYIATPSSITDNIFTINYGKEFTSQPSISVIPNYGMDAGGSTSNLVMPIINKSSLTQGKLFFARSTTYPLPASSGGTLGLLGFDLIITGPVKMGVNSGNSNKGWAVNDTTIADPTCVYSSLDVNLGSTFGPTVPNSSVIISKNLKLLGSDNNILAYTSSTSTLDYTQTIWKIADGVNLTTLTPQKGMILIIYAYSFIATFTTFPTITLVAGKKFNYDASNLNKLTFGTPGDSVTLYGDGLSRFIILNKSATVSVTAV